MASSMEYVQYLCDQMRAAGTITFRQMFGDYCVYCNGKMIGLICDNQLFIKKTAAGGEILKDCPERSPYPGAKPHFLLENVENRELLTKFICATYEVLPLKKKRSTSG